MIVLVHINLPSTYVVTTLWTNGLHGVGLWSCLADHHLMNLFLALLFGVVVCFPLAGTYIYLDLHSFYFHFTSSI